VNNLEKLNACREVRAEYHEGQVDVVTALVEMDEILAGGGKNPAPPHAMIDFLEDEWGAQPGLPSRRGVRL